MRDSNNVVDVWFVACAGNGKCATNTDADHSEKQLLTVKVFLRSIARDHRDDLNWLPLVIRYYRRCVSPAEVSLIEQTGQCPETDAGGAHCLILADNERNTRLIASVCERLYKDLKTLRLGFMLLRTMYEVEYENSLCTIVKVRQSVYGWRTSMQRDLWRCEDAVSTAKLSRERLGEIGSRFAWDDGNTGESKVEIEEVLRPVAEAAMQRIELLTNLLPVCIVTCYLVPQLGDLDWEWLMFSASEEMRRIVREVMPTEYYQDPLCEDACSMWNWTKCEFNKATSCALRR